MLLFFAILMCIPTASQSETFVASPNHVTVQNDTDITFNCAVISDVEIKAVMWSIGSTLFSLDDAILGLKTTRIILTAMSVEEITKLVPEGTAVPKFMKGFSLTFSPLLSVDDGQISCRTTNSQPNPESAIISVLVPPKPPILTTSTPSSDWTEGQVIIFTCSSGEGNPYPSILIEWFYSGKQMFPSDGVPLLPDIKKTITPPTVKFGDFTSELTIRFTRTVFDGIILCTVSHKIPPKNLSWSYESEGIKLLFKYGPYMKIVISSPKKTVDLVDMPTNQINVLEKTDLNFTCSVDSYPFPNSTEPVSWSYGKTTIPGTKLELKNISRDRNGEVITCYTNEGVPYNENNFTVNVLYPPTLKFPPNITDSTIHIFEGYNLNFSFIVLANPFPQQDDFYWSVDDREISTGQYLKIMQADRIKTNYYTCKVTNWMLPFDSESRTIGSDVLALRLVVNFVPGRAILASTKNSAYKGGFVNFTCTVYGSDVNSEMSVIWSKDETTLNTSSVGSWTSAGDSLNPPNSLPYFAKLNIDRVTNQNKGQYRCKGKNSAGEGELSAPVSFDVYDPPYLVSYFPINNLLEPTEGEILTTLKCEVAGRPKPKIVWVKNNHDVDKMSYNNSLVATPTAENQTSYIVSSSFQMNRPLRASDAGNYSCLAFLSGGDTLTMRAILVAVKQQPIFTDPPVNITAHLNHTTFITCQCYAYPIPELDWFKDGKPLQLTKLQFPSTSWRWVNDTRNNWLLIHESRLTIQGVLESDAGVYVCQAKNVIGITNRTIYVIVRTPPKPPEQVLFLSTTWESIELIWYPGFDGGYPQIYRVSYYVKGGNYNASNPALLGSGMGGLINVTVGTALNITGLLPDKLYLVIVYGINLLGESNGSEIEVKTHPYHMPNIMAVTYLVRNTAVYFAKVPGYVDDLCVYLRTDNMSSPDALNISCRAVGAGSYEYSVHLPVDRTWVASFCLQRRNDVCGETNVVMIDRRPIGTESAIALGVVCSLFLITLIGALGVVIYWCVKRDGGQDFKEQKKSIKSKPVVKRKWSQISHLKNHNGETPEERLVTGSIGSRDSNRRLEHETTNSDHSKSSDKANQGFINKTFYYDSSNAFDLSDSGPESSQNREKVYHEVVV